MKNQSIGKSWNLSGSLSKTLFHGLVAQRRLQLRRSRKNTIDPGSTAFSSWAHNQHAGDPNNPGLGHSSVAQGHRVFVQTSYTQVVLRLRRDDDLGVLGSEAS